MTSSLPLEKRHHLRVVSVVSVVSQHFAVFRAFGPAAVPFLGSSLTLPLEKRHHLRVVS